MDNSKEIYYVEDTQDDQNSYWIDEEGTIITKTDIRLYEWNKINNKAYLNSGVLRKRTLIG